MLLGEPIPVYGQGFFHVEPGRILYIIVFDYIDEDHYYLGLARRGLLSREERALAENMQALMDEERVLINGEEVRPVVRRSSIEIRGDPSRPSITFFTDMEYRPRRGTNVYENLYEETRAEYDYTVYWIPGRCTRIIGIESPGRVTVGGDISVIRVRRGSHIPGYESVTFQHTCI